LWADWCPPSPTPVDLVPIYPVNVLMIGSDCPHRGPIRDGSDCYCEVCAAVSGPNQWAIDVRSVGLPPPEDPELVIGRLRGRLQAMTRDGILDDQEKSMLEARIAGLEALIDHVMPTKYVPDPRLKGGTGK
jgi:hypothetical protein